MSSKNFHTVARGASTVNVSWICIRYPFARAAASARQIDSAVMGTRSSSTPKGAERVAHGIRDGGSGRDGPTLPTPLIPNGVTGDGVSRWSSSKAGRSAAVA